MDRQNKKIRRIIQDLEYSKAEEKYQRKQKIETRKRFKMINEKYKKVMLQNELLETKINNIQKTIEGISKNTIDSTLNKVKFLPKVIEYDRYQPEFYEDTKTYISKRSGDKKILLGSTIYKNNQILIDDVENKFNVEKEL